MRLLIGVLLTAVTLIALNWAGMQPAHILIYGLVAIAVTQIYSMLDEDKDQQ